METFVRARVDAGKKAQAEANLKAMGLNMSTAIRSFIYIVAETGEIPFELKVPNEMTLRAFKDIEEGKTMKAKSIDDLMDKLNA